MRTGKVFDLACGYDFGYSGAEYLLSAGTPEEANEGHCTSLL
jgi:hypothetical protein